MNSTKGRVLADIMDSSLGLSPMGNLTMNFSGTSLSSTPCYRLVGRRLSMSSLTPSTPTDGNSLIELSDGKCATPRISKNALRSGTRRGSLFRRMNSAPGGSLSDSSETGQDGNSFNGRKDQKCMTDLSPAKKDSYSRDSGFTESCEMGTRKGASESLLKSSSHISDANFKCKSPVVRKNDGKLKIDSVFSFDDGFPDIWDLEKSFTDENEDLPLGMKNLLKGPLLTGNGSEEDKANLARPPLRRFNSLMDNYSSPASSKARVGLFRDEILTDDASHCEKLPFKRPREIDTNSSKRRKSNSLHTISERIVKETSNSRYKLQRSISETAASSLAQVLHKTDLIADFTRPYALPIVSGRHEDLKSITSDTLAGLLNGEYDNKVDSFTIIDCRYPYEYEGGHIKGSINLYTKEQVEQELFPNGACVQDLNSSAEEESNRKERNILIFHCEFSLERGPSLYRFLRRCDRNLSSYPSLHYPEVYLLHGGYESFFSTHKSLCDPCSYQPMVDPKHENDLKKFRVKSNSWSGDPKKQGSRSGLKRLGLF